MGGGASAEKRGGSDVVTLDTFKALQNAYESSSPEALEPVALFDLLAAVYEREQNQTTGAAITSKRVDEDKQLEQQGKEQGKSAMARLERNKSFIAACGAFSKGSARADIEEAKKILQEGVDVDYVDNDGWSALFHACGEGHLSVVEWLTESCKASVELKDPEGCTPLWVAAFNNRRNVVQHLLRIGADDKIRAEPDGEPVQTPSFAARRNKHPGIADFIDEETALRIANPSRRGRQIAREMTLDEFRESMRKKGGQQAS